MEYDRIFCFGCSWTNYRWPTWADIARYGSDVPVYNWGLRGIGNVGILHRMVEADLKHKFTDKDLIMVQWSTWTREDRFITEWTAGGSVFNHPLYGDDFVKKYWHWNNDVIKNATAIISANKMFNIGFQFTFYPFPKAPDFDKVSRDVNTDLLTLYQTHLPTILTFPEDLNTDFGKSCKDGHADIGAHLQFFNTHIKYQFGFDLKGKELGLMVLHDVLSNKLSRFQSHEQQWKIIKDEVVKFDKTIDGPTLGY
jgi:hypothetical protein